jgi:hypothetical protein
MNAVAAVACVGAPRHVESAAPREARTGSLDEVYERAVLAAKSGGLPRTSTLTPLRACSSTDATTMPTVRVATWGNGPLRVSEGRLELDTWVTVVPEIQDRCASWHLSGASLDLRLRQLLGLPPAWASDRVSELTVSCADIFRPCPDPDTTDGACEREFPPHVTDAHRAWFETQRRAAFDTTPAFPWTALGYTFDWSSNDRSPANGEGIIGLSEYVVRRGAHVEAVVAQPSAVYCRDR